MDVSVLSYFQRMYLCDRHAEANRKACESKGLKSQVGAL